jgi:hypothetical protein
VALLSLVGGCRPAPPTGKVSGQVTVAGAPIQFGNIAFLSPQGRVATGNIQNGAFQVAGVPVGETRVTVQAVRLGTPVGHPTLGPLLSSSNEGKHVDVPARYALPDKSDLHHTVTAGEQVVNFDLEAK